MKIETNGELVLRIEDLQRELVLHKQQHLKSAHFDRLMAGVSRGLDDASAGDRQNAARHEIGQGGEDSPHSSSSGLHRSRTQVATRNRCGLQILYRP